MKLSELLFLHYARKAAKAVSSKPVPFEATIHVQIPLADGAGDDDDDDDDRENDRP